MKLGMLNSRMNDFFDLWHLIKTSRLMAKTFAAAIKDAFGTAVQWFQERDSLALTAEFYDDQENNVQWNAFLNKLGLSVNARSLQEKAGSCRLLMPVSYAVADQTVFAQDWKPSGTWK